MPFRRFCAAIVLVAAGMLSASSPQGYGQARPPVDLLLILSIDCSYSVDAREFALQAQGLARAFRDPDVIAAIGRGAYGRIAVSVVQWSDQGQEAVVVPWMEVSGAAAALVLSQKLATMARVSAIGATSITSMIRFGLRYLAQAPFRSARQVIDIATDGRNNIGGYPMPLRDLAISRGVTINGLAILNEVPTLDKYFELYVAGGPANFVISANNYDAFAEAIKRKLIMEITGAGLS